jgi:hypothetical protein
MGRPTAPLRAEAIEPALDYIRRALTRKADVFARPMPATAAAYADLLNRSKTTKTGDWPSVVNAWVDLYLSPQGRTAMLAALRRRKADAAGAPRRSRTLRISEATHADLVRFAARVGIPAATAFAHLLHVGLVDKQLQAMVKKLAIATSLKA